MHCETITSLFLFWEFGMDMRMKRIIEIRSAEGGADAQQFVGDLAIAFEKLCLRKR